MGRLGRTCGAVTGALMVLGLKSGSSRADDKEAKDRTYALVREFVARFEGRHGASGCAELLDVNIASPEGLSAARDAGLFKLVCPGLVASATVILEEMGL
jgi:C_GCAxxG_C_C family probable redox protein